MGTGMNVGEVGHYVGLDGTSTQEEFRVQIQGVRNQIQDLAVSR